MATVTETHTPVLSQPGRRRRVRPIWEIVLEMAESHPEAELDKIPHDAAEDHDHYLYGSPRKVAE